MIDTNLLTFVMEWVSKNNLGLLLVVIAIVPLVAMVVVGYTVHVLAKIISKDK